MFMMPLMARITLSEDFDAVGTRVAAMRKVDVNSRETDFLVPCFRCSSVHGTLIILFRIEGNFH